MIYNTIEKVKEVMREEARKPNGGAFRLAIWRIKDETYQSVADRNLTSKQEVLEALGFRLVGQE